MFLVRGAELLHQKMVDHKLDRSAPVPWRPNGSLVRVGARAWAKALAIMEKARRSSCTKETPCTVWFGPEKKLQQLRRCVSAVHARRWPGVTLHPERSAKLGDDLDAEMTLASWAAQRL